MSIFGIKSLAPSHCNLFRDVHVLLILSNLNDIDHIRTHSIVLDSYCAPSFFPLLMYRLCQFLTNKNFFVRKVNIRVHAVHKSLCNIIYLNGHIYIAFWHKHEIMNKYFSLCKKIHECEFGFNS